MYLDKQSILYKTQKLEYNIANTILYLEVVKQTVYIIPASGSNVSQMYKLHLFIALFGDYSSFRQQKWKDLGAEQSKAVRMSSSEKPKDCRSKLIWTSVGCGIDAESIVIIASRWPEADWRTGLFWPHTYLITCFTHMLPLFSPTNHSNTTIFLHYCPPNMLNSKQCIWPLYQLHKWSHNPNSIQ